VISTAGGGRRVSPQADGPAARPVASEPAG